MSAPNETERQEDAYFSSQPPPKNLESHVAAARSFIDHHAASSRRIVLLTSGGTTVPLEKQTVRFIDNFSAGTRGATSAEYFLEAGYAVIFLHRQFSLQPYSRHYSHATDCFLDFLAEGDDGTVVANPGHQERMRAVLRKYTAAKRNNMLLMLPFTTITDYLFELRAIAGLLRPLGPSALLYLAAAVSDFFLPQDRMAEHKIQSTNATESFGSGGAAAPVKDNSNSNGNGNGNGNGNRNGASPEDEETFDNFDSSPKVPRSKRLIVDLDPVPKFLQNLVDGWAPQGMVVSFKLETDPSILVHKAKYSLERYQHHLVIGNLLSTRKWEVVFVAPGQADRWVRVPSAQRKCPAGDGSEAWEDKPLDPSALPEGDPEVEIESLIIPAVQDLHSQHIQSLQK
ncbi:DNA/pantothenate metabolism flavoprotein [Colletotrichum graminicola]|uniref:DNA/pantothenate metabolism flavoprotein n=1 Tax=Colletotrichum graminicola (strain M1.001 / M2 / FGSC 10212) TaxID=645133 RepID=E3Q771_COLGM|nr:DNA/pantothenate metabolism flavoprotein [Colletotrichum graminicola M1.001]EFQ26709.1 DNA/pantothenate metabolism flavoprotein [Colletotrichum graminicola M1.001]WDK17765.1 DNA/pantothenate metabolism flavoprotein [Colletotrichum graminicola]